MNFRPGHVEKLVEAQRVFDRAARIARTEEMGRAAAVIGALYRNASEPERRAYQARLDQAGRTSDFYR